TELAIKEIEVEMLSTKANISQMMQTSMKELRDAHESASKVNAAAQEQLDTGKKQLDLAQSIVEQMQGSKRKADTLLIGIGLSPPPSFGVKREELEHLMDIKILRSMRTALPADAYAKLEKELIPGAGKGLRRSIYDAKHSSALPGTLVRSEGQPMTADAAVT